MIWDLAYSYYRMHEKDRRSLEMSTFIPSRLEDKTLGIVTWMGNDFREKRKGGTGQLMETGRWWQQGLSPAGAPLRVCGTCSDLPVRGVDVEAGVFIHHLLPCCKETVEINRLQETSEEGKGTMGGSLTTPATGSVTRNQYKRGRLLVALNAAECAESGGTHGASS